MTTIYLLRHGKDVNPKNLIKGRLSGFPLADEGRAAIKKAAQRLSGEPIAVIYTSPLLRTKQSAEVFRRVFPKTPLKILGELNEWEAKIAGKPRSAFEGKPLSFFEKQCEPAGEVEERMRKAAKIIARENPGGSAAAFSHGWPIIALKLSLEGKKVSWPLWSLPYNEILVLKLDEELNLLEPSQVLRFDLK